MRKIISSIFLLLTFSIISNAQTDSTKDVDIDAMLGGDQVPTKVFANNSCDGY